MSRTRRGSWKGPGELGLHGAVPPMGRGAHLRLDVPLPPPGEGLRAEPGGLRGVGAAGRLPVPGPTAGEGRRCLKQNNMIQTLRLPSPAAGIRNSFPSSVIGPDMPIYPPTAQCPGTLQLESSHNPAQSSALGTLHMDLASEHDPSRSRTAPCVSFNSPKRYLVVRTRTEWFEILQPIGCNGQ